MPVARPVFFCLFLPLAACLLALSPAPQARAECYSKTCFDGKHYPCDFDCRSLLPSRSRSTTPRVPRYTPPKPRGPSQAELERIQGMRLNEANEKGIDAYRKGHYALAIAYFKRALTYAPHNPNLQYNLKRARQKYQRQKREREALQARLRANVEAARQKRLADEKARLEAVKKGEAALKKREAELGRKEAQARRQADELRAKLEAQRKRNQAAHASAAQGPAMRQAASAAQAGGQAARERGDAAKGGSGRAFDTPGPQANPPAYRPAPSKAPAPYQGDPLLGREVEVPPRFQNDPQVKKMQARRKKLADKYQEMDRDLAVLKKTKDQNPDLKANLEVVEAKLKQKQSLVRNQILYEDTKLTSYVIDLDKELKAAQGKKAK